MVVDCLEQRLHAVPAITHRVAAHRIKPLQARHLLFPVNLHDAGNEAVRHIAIRSRVRLLLQLRILHVVGGDAGTQFRTLACAIGDHRRRRAVERRQGSDHLGEIACRHIDHVRHDGASERAVLREQFGEDHAHLTATHLLDVTHALIAVVVLHSQPVVEAGNLSRCRHPSSYRVTNMRSRSASFRFTVALPALSKRVANGLFTWDRA